MGTLNPKEVAGVFVAGMREQDRRRVRLNQTAAEYCDDLWCAGWTNKEMEACLREVVLLCGGSIQ